ncbi:hypothetical protein Mal64_16720 [Pseudobythopirellula maris]|uniref:Putative zinc-finger domain-containing protein n=1 Tax=Pseudobythopirellula maris TaxID=2527991 RepID=A0A5C5ZP28_9BACT|nr:zf-HC2 domain-containing protein [Pseudobythopirellula maris]TWT88193.1 hypothetical protein Mal64_16720 [Pseudobythopirellula maris]
MNHHTTNPTNGGGMPVDAELLSAFVDGELSPDDAARVDEALRTSAEARSLVDDFRRLRSVMDAPAGVSLNRDLAPAVLQQAHAEREEAEWSGGIGASFGGSSRGWVWGGVAAAAALFISFFGAPQGKQAPQAGAPSAGAVASHNAARSARAVPVSLANDPRLVRVMQANPGMRLVSVRATPEGRRSIERLLASQGIALARGRQAAVAPQLVNADRAGLIVETSSAPSLAETEDDEFVLVDADNRQVQTLLDKMHSEQGELFQVEEDRVWSRPEEISATADASSLETIQAPGAVSPNTEPFFSKQAADTEMAASESRVASSLPPASQAAPAAPSQAYRIQLRVRFKPGAASTPATPQAGASSTVAVSSRAAPTPRSRVLIVFRNAGEQP